MVVSCQKPPGKLQMAFDKRTKNTLGKKREDEKSECMLFAKSKQRAYITIREDGEEVVYTRLLCHQPSSIISNQLDDNGVS